jgi:hypothetical protein
MGRTSTECSRRGGYPRSLWSQIPSTAKLNTSQVGLGRGLGLGRRLGLGAKTRKERGNKVHTDITLSEKVSVHGGRLDVEFVVRTGHFECCPGVVGERGACGHGERASSSSSWCDRERAYIPPVLDLQILLCATYRFAPSTGA